MQLLFAPVAVDLFHVERVFLPGAIPFRQRQSSGPFCCISFTTRRQKKNARIQVMTLWEGEAVALFIHQEVSCPMLPGAVQACALFRQCFPVDQPHAACKHALKSDVQSTLYSMQYRASYRCLPDDCPQARTQYEW